MVYTQLLKSFFRLCYGEPPDLSQNGASEALVYVADGVGGLDLCAVGLRYVMGSLKLRYQVRNASWGHGFGRWHADLTDTSHLEAQAAEVATRVEEFRELHPHAPVYLVGKSGGTAVVVKALERLPQDAVESVVLLSSALSPPYDLSKALTAVRHEMTVFWSPLDVFVLGAGTLIFGTIDRVHSVAAGLVGFRIPEGIAPEQGAEYSKLRQVRWHPAMSPTGYMGGHVGPDCPAFLRKYVVPLLQQPSGAGLRPSAAESRV